MADTRAQTAGRDRWWYSLVFFAALIIAWATPIYLFDFWWQLKNGEIMLASGQLPRVDVFSFTAAGQPFSYANIWLTDVLYAVLHAVGGLPAVVSLNGLLLAGAWALTVMAARAMGARIQAAALAVLMAVIVIPIYGNTRPQAFSIFFFALFNLILASSVQCWSKAVWVLPALMALWSNLHGAFTIGLVLVGVYAAVPLLKAVIDQRRAWVLLDTPQPGWIGLGITCALASWLNPDGPAAWLNALGLVGHYSSRMFISEWQAPQLGNLFDLPFFALLAVDLFILLHFWRRLTLLEWLLLGVFTALPFYARRAAIWFVLIAQPIVALRLNQWVATTQPRPEVYPAGWQPSPRMRGIAMLLLTVALVPSVPWIQQRLLPGRGLINPQTPVAAAEFMAQNNLEGSVFAPQEYGDYLIWRLYPRNQVFIDGRAHLYPAEVWRDYIQAMNGINWREIMDRYQVDYVLLERRGPDQAGADLEAALRDAPDWSLVYEDEHSILFAAPDHRD